MRQKHGLWMIGFCVLILLAGCKDKIDSEAIKTANAKMVQVSVAVAKVEKQPLLYNATGTVEARIASTLSSNLMGTVTAVNVREGDVVKKEDLLVVIDKRQVAADLRKAEAAFAEAKRAKASAESALASAKAGLELATATYNRYLKLMEDASASRQEFDEVEARHRQAQASFSQATSMLAAARSRVRQAQAAVSAAAARESDARIRAPYDGRVTAKMIEVGDLAAPGVPILTLEKQDANCVVFEVPEQHIPAVYLQQKVIVSIPSLQEKIVEAVVGRIDPSADQKSRSFRVRAMLPEDISIRSGMYAKVELPVGEAGQLIIPSTAVVREGQLTGIYLVDESQIAHFRLIRIGKTNGEKIEVVSGLKAGDKYILMLPPDLADGTKVEMTS